MATFDLCPKCGAVSKDGVCSSCGYKIPGIYNGAGINDVELVPIAENKGSKQNTPVIILCVAVALVLLVATVGVTFGVTKKMLSDLIVKESVTSSSPVYEINPPQLSVEYDEEEMIYSYGYYDGHLYGYLEESADSLVTGEWKKLSKDPYVGTDPEAYEFDTYIDDSLSYDIEENTWEFSNENGEYDELSNNVILPHFLVLKGNYFRLSNTGSEFEDAVNDMIYKRALAVSEVGEHGVYYLSMGKADRIVVDNKAYVAYMDEKVLSIAFLATGTYCDDETGDTTDYFSYLSSINIDLTTGREIKASETFAFDGDFYKTFKARCLEQNGSPVDYYDDEVLITVLTDDDEVFWVYTPLGLEVGVNREYYSGWSTGTFTDYSKFYKIY